MPLPAHGRPVEDVLRDLDALAADDKDFRGGRTFGLVFHVDAQFERAIHAAHDRFLWHNALSVDAFPSLRQMQADVVDIATSLMGGEAVVAAGGEAAGFMTSGGTESILLAVEGAKVRARRDRGIERPNIVLPTSAHAAFDKACSYFSLESRRVAVRDDWRADVDAMANAVDDDTVLLVGSAPQYPQGVVDPIPAIAAIAAERGISCHSDACMGGFVLPFLERLGATIPPWDFRVEGVTSISADLHKYAYVPKGASVLIHRSKALRRDHTFLFDGWLGGVYGSSGILGTKPGGPIAAAWASLQLLGADGFATQVGRAVEVRERLVAGVRGVPGLDVVGEPEATMAAIYSPDASVDVFAVHDLLSGRGWHLDRQGPPDSLHATCTPVQVDVVDDLVADIADAVTHLSGARTEDRSTRYSSF
ncbi:MAG: pyridoxal phosphate-dependent decarboxylase family protein [Acidimicrobiales bacterium]